MQLLVSLCFSLSFHTFLCLLRSVRGAPSALKEKLEVKMTKAFCKLQGLVFTILSSGSTFSPAACWMLSGLLLFFLAGKNVKNTRAGYKYRAKPERP